jgi:hypothetical protein
VTKWRFNLRQSKDLSLIGELTGASGKSLTLGHNTPGSANWDYSMSDELAKYIQPINTCISAERYNWRATLALNNAGTHGQVWDWIWSGFVLPLDEDWTNDRMKVSCVGWAQRLAMRQIKRDKVYTNSDDGPIFKDLLDEMNLSPSRMPQTTRCRPWWAPIPSHQPGCSGAGWSRTRVWRRDNLRATLDQSR